MSTPTSPSPVRGTRWYVAAALVVALGTAGAVVAGVFTAAPSEAASYTIWTTSSPAPTDTDHEDRAVTLGTAFSSSAAGTVSAVRIYRTAGDDAAHQARLWSPSGAVVARLTIPASSRTGWSEAALAAPVKITAGAEYVVSYVAEEGQYAATQGGLSTSRPVLNRPLTATRGVYTYGSGKPAQTWRDSSYFVDVRFEPTAEQTPVPSPSGAPTSAPSTPGSTLTPTPTTPAPTSTSPTRTPSQAPTSQPSAPAPTDPSTAGGFPDASNTGVPPGTTLTPYTGPTTITKAGTTINAKTINGDVLIKADDVTITNSTINGRLSSDFGGSVTVTHSLIDGGNQETFPTVSYSNITLDHVNVTGGQHSVQCSDTCTITNSWLHDQYLPATSAGHVNAFITNGGHDLVLRHNTVHCTVPLTRNDGGCSGDVSLFGDFDPIRDVTIDNNYFRANQQSISYCLYAGYNPSKPYGSNPTNVHVTNNVFERGANNKCGVYGPVTSFLKANGNTWSNNTFAGSTTQIPSAE